MNDSAEQDPAPLALPFIYSDSGGEATTDTDTNCRIPDLVMEDQILNREYRAKYVSADKYRDIVQKLALIRKERAQLAKAFEELKDENERYAMDAVMKERRRAEVHLTASLSQKNEEYIAVTEKYESELRSASNKHSEQLEKAMHESFIQSKFLEEKIEALKRANINLERENRAEMEHYKQENQRLLDQLEAERCEREKAMRHVDGLKGKSELCFEELQLLRNVHTEKEKEIDKLKRQIVELQEQVALTEKLNDYHNERFEQYETEGRRQLEKELHQSSVERRKLEERHAGDIEERERKLEELLRHREEALKEAKVKEELLKLKVQEHDGAMQEIEQLRKEYQIKARLQVHANELKLDRDRMYEELQAEKNKTIELKQDNKKLESKLEDANEQMEEKEEALKKARNRIESLTEKLEENKTEKAKLEDALQGRESKMQDIRRRSTGLEMQLKETEDMHKSHQENATKSNQELRHLLEQERAAKEKVEMSKDEILKELEQLQARASAQAQAIETEKNAQNELNGRLQQSITAIQEKEGEIEEFRKKYDALKIDSEALKRRLDRTEDTLRRREKALRDIREAHDDASASREELEETLKEKETHTKRLWGVFKEKWEHRERSIEELQLEKQAAIEEGLQAKKELKERFRAQEELLNDATTKVERLEKELRESMDAKSMLEEKLRDREEHIIKLKEENRKHIEGIQKALEEARERRRMGEEAARNLQKELDKKESIIVTLKKEHSDELSHLKKELEKVFQDAETHRRKSVGLKEKEQGYLQQFNSLKEEFEEKLKSQASKYQQELDRRKRQYLEEVKVERDKKEEVKKTLHEYKKKLGSAEKHLKVLQHKNESLRERMGSLEKDVEDSKRRLTKVNKQVAPQKAEQRVKTPPVHHISADDKRIRALEKMVEPIPEILRSIHHLSTNHEHSRLEREELEEENKDLKYVLEARYPLKDSPKIETMHARESLVVSSPASSSAFAVHSPGARTSPPSSPGKFDISYQTIKAGRRFNYR